MEEYDTMEEDVEDSTSCETADDAQLHHHTVAFRENTQLSQEQKELIIQYVNDLKSKEKRAKALIELSKNREHYQELAPYIWHSVGTIAAL